jgi:hypothetical protein
VSDIYAYWRAACSPSTPDDRLAALRLPTVGHGGGEDPQCGLWKVRMQKGAPPVLMQIWLNDEFGKPAIAWAPGLRVMNICAGKELPLLELCERWLFAEPATKDEAAHFKVHGRWPADPPPITRTHNLPADPFEALKLEVEERLEQAERLLKAPIADQLACDTATNHQRELTALLKRADAMHEAEKRPHLEAGRAVDARFRFRDTIATWSTKLRSAYEGWMAAEEARQQAERDRQYREQVAAAEAERQRIEAERAQKLADDPVAALTDPEPEPLPMPAPPEPVKMRAGGGVGRKAGLKDDWDIQITDYKLAALQVIEDPDISIMVGKVLMRRVRAAKGKIDIPGVTITKIRRAA